MFNSPAKMAEGVVLYDPMEQTFGKIIFSLAQIPLGVGFQTDRGTSIVRITDDQIVLNGRLVINVSNNDIKDQAEQVTNNNYYFL